MRDSIPVFTATEVNVIAAACGRILGNVTKGTLRIASEGAKSVFTLSRDKGLPAAGKIARTTGAATKDVGTKVIRLSKAVVRNRSGEIGIECPACGNALVVRRNKKTGHSFIACSGYFDEGCTFVAKIEIEEQ